MNKCLRRRELCFSYIYFLFIGSVSSSIWDALQKPSHTLHRFVGSARNFEWGFHYFSRYSLSYDGVEHGLEHNYYQPKCRGNQIKK